MPDATNKATVDGVEPTILVKYVGTNDGRELPGCQLHSFDDGTLRFIKKDGPNVLVTPGDLAVLGEVGVAVEQIDEAPVDEIPVDETSDSAPVETSPDTTPAPQEQTAPEETINTQTILPGQSGQ